LLKENKMKTSINAMRRIITYSNSILVHYEIIARKKGYTIYFLAVILLRFKLNLKLLDVFLIKKRKNYNVSVFYYD